MMVHMIALRFAPPLSPLRFVQAPLPGAEWKRSPTGLGAPVLGNFGHGESSMLKMLASVWRSVESESAPGFGPVTFCNRMIIRYLMYKSGSRKSLVSLAEDGNFA